MRTADRPKLPLAPMDQWLMDHVVCPVDHRSLIREKNWFICSHRDRHRYPIVDEIPVFLRNDIDHTAWWSAESLETARKIADGKGVLPEPAWDGSGVHPHVQSIIDSTGGHLYKAARGKLTEYPIPSIRIPVADHEQILLDAGCNWGRWTLSAAKRGIPSIGVDPSLGAVVAARQIRSQLDLPCSFFVGDCRWLPFPDSTFTDVFSYSVVQHFSKSNAQVSIAEFQRVLNANGICLVQMPNVFGIRSFYHLARRRFSEGSKFDVRYYTPNELRNIFEAVFGNAALSVDGFFGLGIQVDDLRFMPWKNRVIINASEVLRSLANKLPMLVKLADSLYVTSVKERAPANTH